MMPHDFPFTPPAGGPFSSPAPFPMAQFWNQMLGTWWGMLGSMAQPFMGYGANAGGAPADSTGWGRHYQNPVAGVPDVRPPVPEPLQSRTPSVAQPSDPQLLVVVVVGRDLSLNPADVVVDILPDADLTNLQLMPLHAINEETPRAITGKLQSKGTSSLYLSLNISPDLPKGTYVGSLYDRTRGEVAGSVSLRLEA